MVCTNISIRQHSNAVFIWMVVVWILEQHWSLLKFMLELHALMPRVVKYAHAVLAELGQCVLHNATTSSAACTNTAPA